MKTDFQHNDMRDTGPDEAKNSIQGMLDKFLSDDDSDVAPVDTQSSPPKILEPGPVALCAACQELTEPLPSLVDHRTFEASAGYRLRGLCTLTGLQAADPH